MDGEDVAPADDGSFSHDMDLDFGINVIETTANDNDVDESGDSNETTDARSVLYSSDWFSPDWYREEALLIRVNEGPGGLDQFGPLHPRSWSPSTWTPCWAVAVLDQRRLVDLQL